MSNWRISGIGILSLGITSRNGSRTYSLAKAPLRAANAPDARARTSHEGRILGSATSIFRLGDEDGSGASGPEESVVVVLQLDDPPLLFLSSCLSDCNEKVEMGDGEDESGCWTAASMADSIEWEEIESEVAEFKVDALLSVETTVLLLLGGDWGMTDLLASSDAPNPRIRSRNIFRGGSGLCLTKGSSCVS